MTTSRRNRRWPYLVAVVGVVLAVLAGSGAVATQLLVDRWARSVGQDELLAPDARDHGESDGSDGADGSDGSGGALPGDPDVSGPLTYLVVGTDRQGADDDEPVRTDAIVVVHLRADLRQGYLLSIPRDLRVPIPGHGTGKINAAYEAGGGGRDGVRLLSQTLRQVSGLRFDGAAVVDFHGFESVIDTLGGVELCLDRRVESIHTGDVFPAGCQRLDGAEALDLSRQRYGLPEGDFDRGRNHQRLLQAMVAQARSGDVLTDPVRLDRTVRAVGDSLTVDTGGVPLPELAVALRHLRADQLTGVTLPARSQQRAGGWYVVGEPAADGLFQAIRQDDVGRWLEAHPQWRND